MSDNDFEQLRLNTGHLHLAALARGPADGLPVLALHGWLDNAASFVPLAPWLPGIRLVALELPGHGHSDHRPAGQGYNFLDYTDDVLAAADALGWERFSVMGHSLGGSIGTMLAGACPERIERLALIESIGPLSEDAANAPWRLANALARRRRSPGRRRRHYASIDEAVEARHAVGGLSEAAARLLVERSIVADETGVRWRSDPRLRYPTPYRLTEEQVLGFLRAIRAPTLVIGAQDGLVQADDAVAASRLAAIADVRMHQLPGHHHLHMEDPDPVAELIGPFLRGEA